MGSKRAVLAIGALIFLTSVPAAHADPSFVLSESQVRAGDVVHFSITGADGRVNYEVEVADRKVLEGSGKGKVVSGQFTMPDLGSKAKGVTVEAEMRDEDGWEKDTRALQYLGAALPSPAPEPKPEPKPEQPAPAPPAPQQTATQAPAPSATPAAPAAKLAAPEPKTHHQRKRAARKRAARKHARKHRRAERPHKTARGSQKHARKSERRSVAKKRKRHRPPPRTAPLFDGVPEPGSENYSPDDESAPGESKAKPRSVFTRAVASRDDGSALAILIPGLLAFAGLSLAAATVLRRRRTG